MGEEEEGFYLFENGFLVSIVIMCGYTGVYSGLYRYTRLWVMMMFAIDHGNIPSSASSTSSPMVVRKFVSRSMVSWNRICLSVCLSSVY